MPPDLKKKVNQKAQSLGISFNEYCLEAVRLSFDDIFKEHRGLYGGRASRVQLGGRFDEKKIRFPLRLKPQVIEEIARMAECLGVSQSEMFALVILPSAELKALSMRLRKAGFASRLKLLQCF